MVFKPMVLVGGKSLPLCMNEIFLLVIFLSSGLQRRPYVRDQYQYQRACSARFTEQREQEDVCLYGAFVNWHAYQQR
jgi:hypothetical protein